MARQLEVVRIEGKEYFVDERLKEYRQVGNPYNRISFEDFANRGNQKKANKKSHRKKRGKGL